MDATARQPISVRDALARNLYADEKVSNTVKIAEDFQNWNSDGTYLDLLTFETHLAELASVIVVILESEGSLAELGLFSAIDGLKQKLQVFIDERHYESQSFIRLGPIKYLEDSLENRAEVEDWLSQIGPCLAYDVEKASALSSDLCNAVVARLEENRTAEESFSEERWLHKILLVCDLLNLFGALTVTEISYYLAELNINFELEALRQALFIVNLVGLVEIKAKSRQRYYLATGSRFFIKFKGLGKEFDFDRYKTFIREYYESSDRKRHLVLRATRS
ncbi:MAG: hypothetical protein CMN27_10870 [Salinisphaera sp.]|nr:hypothetical protein [Salinisphaera sp.]